MIRMIIVDDEYIILDSLKTLINWKSIDVEVIGTADNGEAAVDMVMKLKPDIILSDISMPYLSGLEMLETIRRNNIKTEVIFVTAYGKFEYAQEAIRHGAFDYILKPIEENLLLSAVSRCVEKIRSGLYEKDTDDKIHLNQLVLKNLLSGKIPDELEWTALIAKGPNPERLPNAVVAGFRHAKDYTPAFKQEDFGVSWVSPPLRVTEDLTLFMICFEDKFKTELSTSINKLTRYNPETVAAISSVCALKECFEKAYAQISFALIDAEVRRRKGLVLFTNLEKSSVSSFPGFDSVCSSLSRSIKDGKAEQVREHLYRFFLGFLQKEIFYDSSLVELYCIELVDHVYAENEDYINPAGKNNETPIILAIKKKITACFGLHQVFNVLCEIFFDLCGNINNDQIHSSMRLVRQCIRIIQEQYSTDISLAGAASQLQISPNYLSKIFSAEMTKSFSRYLLEYRIGIAKKLLGETNDKVYEIAGKVGYPDVVHFTKVFKQLTGLSPNRYRNRK